MSNRRFEYAPAKSPTTSRRPGSQHPAVPTSSRPTRRSSCEAGKIRRWPDGVLKLDAASRSAVALLHVLWIIHAFERAVLGGFVRRDGACVGFNDPVTGRQARPMPPREGSIRVSGSKCSRSSLVRHLDRCRLPRATIYWTCGRLRHGRPRGVLVCTRAWRSSGGPSRRN